MGQAATAAGADIRYSTPRARGASGAMPSHNSPPTAQTAQATTMAASQPNAWPMTGVNNGASIPTPFPPVLSSAQASPPFLGSSPAAVVQKIASHVPSAQKASEKHQTI